MINKQIPSPATNMPCPCTLIEQDEDCPVGYPSMICGICKGTGNTTPEQVTALACEMIKIASDNGEPEDPFAAWESIDLIKSQHGQLRAALTQIAGLPILAMQDAWQNSRDMRDIAIAALGTTEGSAE